MGTEVLVDGPESASAPLVLMLHGWPDTRELWQLQVQALKGSHRCARFTWPGFDAKAPEAPRSLDEFVALVDAVGNALSPDAPFVLCLHDWGCIYGYEYLARFPQRVSKVVAMDIGDYNSGALIASMPLSAKLAAAAYQLVLALVWVLGQKLGLHGPANALTRAVAKFMKAPGAAHSMVYSMNLPYAMTWFGTQGGFKKAAKVREPSHPTLYFHGLHKPFQFQSPRWLAAVNARADSKAVSLDTGHWMMLRRADVVNAEMRAFLVAGPLLPA